MKPADQAFVLSRFSEINKWTVFEGGIAPQQASLGYVVLCMY